MNTYTDPIIKKSEAIKAAGNAAKLANLLGITRQYISLWPEFVPPVYAYRIKQMFPNVCDQIKDPLIKKSDAV